MVLQLERRGGVGCQQVHDGGVADLIKGQCDERCGVRQRRELFEQSVGRRLHYAHLAALAPHSVSFAGA